MKRLRLSPAAAADLDSIWDYTATHWDVNQADQYTDELQAACEALAAGKKTGRPVDLRPGTLKVLVGAHMVYFRESDTTLDVIRILHGRQDVSRHL